VHVYIEYVCFVYASSCKRGITHYLPVHDSAKQQNCESKIILMVYGTQYKQPIIPRFKHKSYESNQMRLHYIRKMMHHCKYVTVAYES